MLRRNSLEESLYNIRKMIRQWEKCSLDVRLVSSRSRGLVISKQELYFKRDNGFNSK